MALLGADYTWPDWFEILYRDPELSDANDFFWEPGTSVVHSRDAALFTTLYAWFADASRVYPGVQFVVPLGLGIHRDHQLVFQAALVLSKSIFPSTLSKGLLLPRRINRDPNVLLYGFQLSRIDSCVPAENRQTTTSDRTILEDVPVMSHAHLVPNTPDARDLLAA